jgi:rare lipoprotein A
MVQVTNKNNGRSITVRINDRGPFTLGRVIDLTTAGAGQLGMSNRAPVDLTVLSVPVKSTLPKWLPNWSESSDFLGSSGIWSAPRNSFHLIVESIANEHPLKASHLDLQLMVQNDA